MKLFFAQLENPTFLLNSLENNHPFHFCSSFFHKHFNNFEKKDNKK